MTLRRYFGLGGERKKSGEVDFGGSPVQTDASDGQARAYWFDARLATIIDEISGEAGASKADVLTAYAERFNQRPSDEGWTATETRLVHAGRILRTAEGRFALRANPTAGWGSSPAVTGPRLGRRRCVRHDRRRSLL